MFCTAGPTMQVIAPTIYLTAYRNEFISCSTNEMASVEITYDFKLEYFSVVSYVWYCKSQNSEIIWKRKDNQSHFHSLSFAHINENTRIYGPFAFAFCQKSISQWFDTNSRWNFIKISCYREFSLLFYVFPIEIYWQIPTESVPNCIKKWIFNETSHSSNARKQPKWSFHFFSQHYQLEQTKTKYKIDVRKKQKSQQQLLDVPWTVLNVSHKRIS